MTTQKPNTNQVVLYKPSSLRSNRKRRSLIITLLPWFFFFISVSWNFFGGCCFVFYNIINNNNNSSSSSSINRMDDILQTSFRINNNNNNKEKNEHPIQTTRTRRRNEKQEDNKQIMNCPEGLVPVIRHSISNLGRISSSTTTTTTMTMTTESMQAKLKKQNQRNINFVIPKRIFQTSKSKCVTTKVQQALEQWHEFGGTTTRTTLGKKGNNTEGEENDEEEESWEYYLFDDQDVNDFFWNPLHYQEFPLLGIIVQHCLPYGTLRADLFRYLVLYHYGGIYADIDTVPSKQNFNHDLLFNKDGLFVVEQYHLLSQYFIAISPKHPLMYYAVHAALYKLINYHGDIKQIDASKYTGPHALHQALFWFVESHRIAKLQPKQRPIVHPWKIGTKPVAAGIYYGTNNRSITVIGIGENQNEYIIRDVFRAKNGKNKAYKAMGMIHFSEQIHIPNQQQLANMTCLESIIKNPFH